MLGFVGDFTVLLFQWYSPLKFYFFSRVLNIYIVKYDHKIHVAMQRMMTW